MSPIAAVTIALFGLLVLAPALAAWAFEGGRAEKLRAKPVIEFPSQRIKNTKQHHHAA
jgi:hypothetical protein